MLDFIYDSLDTVKKLKFPTLKQIAQLTIGIFVLVFVAGVYFILADTVFKEGYSEFYSLMTGKEIVPVTQINALSQQEAQAMLSGLQVEAATGTVEVANDAVAVEPIAASGQVVAE